MISTDFAANETIHDALTSLITLASPLRWYRGEEGKKALRILEAAFPGATVIPFLSGRAALSLLLNTLSFPQQSQVILQGFTCEAVAVPVLQNGLKPVYADIERASYSINITDLLHKITPQTKAIILQHSFGMVPVNRDKVLQLAKDRKILVIEDLAHGFTPGFWQKEKLSDKSVLTLSFGRSKALSSVFGGALVTTNKNIIEKIREIETRLPYPSLLMTFKLLCYKPLSVFIKHAYNIAPIGKIIHKTANSLGLIIAEISKKEKEGFYDTYLEKKYPNALAILLLKQLEKFKSMEDQRKLISALYAKELGVKTSGAPPRFPLLVKNKSDLLRELAKKNIYLGDWYSQPVAPKGVELEKVGYQMGTCPTAEEVCREIINLPTLITKEQAEEIIRQIKNLKTEL